PKRFSPWFVASGATNHGENENRKETSSVLALLADAGSLPDAVAHVVELGAADVAAADTLDLGDHRRVQRERALDPDAAAELAHGEGLADAAALAAQHVTLEHLHALTVALDHADVDAHRVARSEVGDVLAQAELVDDVGGVHGRQAPGLGGGFRADGAV